jgi:hypothetical protein
MNNSFPQKMLNTLKNWPEYPKMLDTIQEWPEYKEILDYLRGKGVAVDPYVELVRTLYSLSWRGNVFSDWKYKTHSLCFVPKCIKFHKAEKHIDMVFQLTNTQLIIRKETAVA